MPLNQGFTLRGLHCNNRICITERTRCILCIDMQDENETGNTGLFLLTLVDQYSKCSSLKGYHFRPNAPNQVI